MPLTRNGRRLAVDIGGTFTDIVLEAGNERTTAKVLTTQAAPEEGVIIGITDALERAGIEAEAIDLLIHGTTLATNAIIERKGALTALITTEGFRDVVDIGYESRYHQYDLMIEKPAPLVPRYRRLTVPERVDIRGRILTPLDEKAVLALIPELERLKIQSVAVGFLHSYANPAHERRVGEILSRELPDVSISLSCEVCPEVREFERFTTATANAYVRPLMASYLGRLWERMTAMEFRCPVLLMTSGGGLTTLETAMRFPIRLVESGPAGGAILASRVAAEMGLDKVISFDMGGTTAKICLIDDFEPQTAREFEVDRAAKFTKGSGLPLRIPVIEMVEIGAGGGSVARLDVMKQIAIGPDSAGADPGPAAYDRGGTQPTITDADFLLGRIDPSRFAGGKVKLVLARAEDAIERKVGEPLGLEPRMAAYGITEMVDETMSNAARIHAVERGKTASEYALVAFGGAAPLHASRLAEKLGIRRVVVPTNAGVGSAVGFLRAPVAYDVVRSHNMRLGEFNAATINTLIEEMRVEAMAVVRAGAPDAALTELRTAFMRYLGQGHEIVVRLPLRPLDEADSATLQAAFDREYERLYKRIIPEAEAEVLTWGLTLSTVEERPETVEKPDSLAAPPPAGSRRVFDVEASDEVEVPLYWRPDLAPGMTVDGPAVIAEDETSTFVSGRFNAWIAGNGYIILEGKPEDTP
jgi:N-methylhydantoinase A